MNKTIFLTILIIFSAFMLNNIFSNKSKTDGQASLDQFMEAQQEFDSLEVNSNLVKATFAGGCFWCMEGPLESIEGVEAVVLGYTGGKTQNPTYQQVSLGRTGHKEAALAFYDPKVTKYHDLVEMYWKFIDPTDPDGQFADKGTQYQIAIFYHSLEQKEIAESYVNEMEESGKYDKPIVLEILPATDFYLAEDNHQNYYKKQSKNYKNYYKGSGRENYVESNK